MDSEAAVERRLLAELARQQHQSEEDRRWLQMQEENLVCYYSMYNFNAFNCENNITKQRLLSHTQIHFIITTTTQNRAGLKAVLKSIRVGQKVRAVLTLYMLYFLWSF